MSAAPDGGNDPPPGDPGMDNPPPPDGGMDGTDGSMDPSPETGPDGGCVPLACGGHINACADCVDNDGDLLTDSEDPDCLGPCDNTEGPGLDSGVGGTTGASCGVDCYFDFGNGPGNDDCHWDHRCDPLQPESSCPYDATMLGTMSCPATQSALCGSYCRPLTPNGCDCFGCCTFPALAGMGPSGTDGYVWIGAMDASNTSTCTIASVTDPVACPPCTPVGNCLNTCEHCEVCVGRPMPPPDCFPDGGVDGGVPMQCPAGVQACGVAGQAPCPAGYYCITGCCTVPAPG